MKTEFDYYYGAEAEQFSFVKIPKVLFSDKKHFGKLSIGAKLMYGLLLDRMSLKEKIKEIKATIEKIDIKPASKEDQKS